MAKHFRADFLRSTTFCASIIAGFALSCIAAPVGAQAPSAVSESVSKYVRSEMQRQHIPGLALLVARGGKIVQAEGFGMANVELQVPVKPETVFQSGSVGKQFTATAVMMLVEEG